jgi:oligopeptide transport system ATP-binding protein
MTPALLALDDVKTYFPLRRALFGGPKGGLLKAVDGVSFEVAQGEVLGLVGESGCGKSTLARTILRLIPPTAGSIWFTGRDMAALPPSELRRMRPKLQMIFQDPYASLNPRMTVFDTLAEPIRAHRLLPRKAIAPRVGELMEMVGLARRYVRKYPHEFSGGQRQRIAIARALALKPRFIIADEPVSALDVSVQAQILNLLAGLRREEDLTMVLISHDLSVVAHISDRIAVMYLGKVVELGPAQRIVDSPQHPYTRALISAVPTPESDRNARVSRTMLRGDLPSALHPPGGCPFHPRCPIATGECAERIPKLVRCGEGHWASCLRLAENPRSASQPFSQ